MLNCQTDVWSVHSIVDWDYVNQNYKCAIIGGAGLLHGAFSRFWEEAAEKCKLPIVCWGIGACFPVAPHAQTEPAPRKAVKAVFERSLLVDVRDELTREFYGHSDASVSFCPTAAWIRGEFKKSDSGNATPNVLLVEHVELVPAEDVDARKRTLKRNGIRFKYTDNVQTRFESVRSIVNRYYLGSSVVVTTRLHGAIIARSLGIPVIGISHDGKIDAFVDAWDGVMRAGSDEEVVDILQNCKYDSLEMDDKVFESMYEFGRSAAKVMQDITAI